MAKPLAHRTSSRLPKYVFEREPGELRRPVPFSAISAIILKMAVSGMQRVMENRFDLKIFVSDSVVAGTRTRTRTWQCQGRGSAVRIADNALGCPRLKEARPAHARLIQPARTHFSRGEASQKPMTSEKHPWRRVT